MSCSDNVVSLTVLRTSDGQRSEIEMPLSATLVDLKDKISSSDLGPIDRDHQRLFHLGRELKTAKRSLEALSVGRFNNYLLHLHSTQPQPLELSSDDEDDDDEVAQKQGEKKRKWAFSSERATTTSSSSSSSSQQAAPVVDLLNDSDDEVAVVDAPPVATKRRR